MTTQTVARRLVELCRAGQFEQAQQELFDEDAVSIEPEAVPDGILSDETGLPAIRAKGRRFWGGVEAFHSVRCTEPVIAGNWFSIALNVEATFRTIGRITIHELCVYRVEDGRIVREQFFYDEYEP
ncbi:MAG TPA: nuclear transport factor 2 family protein [Lysobacter sp.]